MSHRELRKFSEIMKMLGYPRLISLENFRTPNFPLVAELLIWLGKRLDPEFDLSYSIDSTTERINLITTFAQFMVIKAHIRLNVKRLYQADGYSVKEMLKIASFLHQAVQQAPLNLEDMVEVRDNLSEFKFHVDVNKVNEMKRARKLASEITKEGASLYDLLGLEMHLKDLRSKVMGTQLDIQKVEHQIQESIKNLKSDTDSLNSNTNSLKIEIENIEQKIEKKKVELERSQKRLSDLKKVRPAFMDEYEKLDSQLKLIYKDYMTKFCCLSFLEQQLEDIEKQEVAKSLSNELFGNKVRGANQYDKIGDLEKALSEDDSEKKIDKRSYKVYGTMTGGYTDQSLDSDTDLDMVDAQDESDLATDEELEIDNMADRKLTKGPIESDDDF